MPWHNPEGTDNMWEKKSWNESFLPEVKSVLLQRKVSERDKQNYSKKTVAKTFKTVQTLTLQKDNLWNCKMKIKVHKLQIHSFDNENWRIYALHFSLKNAVRELTFRRHVTNRQTSRTVNMSPAAIPVTITTMELGEDASDQSNTDLLPFTALESVTPRKWKKQKNNFSFFSNLSFSSDDDSSGNRIPQQQQLSFRKRQRGKCCLIHKDNFFSFSRPFCTMLRPTMSWSLSFPTFLPLLLTTCRFFRSLRVSSFILQSTWHFFGGYNHLSSELWVDQRSRVGIEFPSILRGLFTHKP